MTGIKPSSHGIVVEHNESGVRYAVSDRNHNPAVAKKIRDLKPGESVLTYRPRRKGSLGELAGSQGSPEAAGDQEVGSGDRSTDQAGSNPGTKTEGATNGTQEKEGK